MRPDWQNNISLQRTPARAQAPEQVAHASCPTLSTELRTALGTEVKVTSCGVRTLAGTPFVAIEYRVPAKDVSIVQYEIPFGFLGTPALVGGSNDAGLANLRATQAAIAVAAIQSLHRVPAEASAPAR